MVTVEDLRNHLHLTPDDDSDLEKELQAARSKARSAGIPAYKDNALYDEFLLNYAAMLHDNRGMSSGNGDTDKMQRMVNSYVLELRYAGEDSDG